MHVVVEEEEKAPTPIVSDDESSVRGSVDLQEGESRLGGYACVASGMLSQMVSDKCIDMQ